MRKNEASRPGAVGKGNWEGGGGSSHESVRLRARAARVGLDEVWVWGLGNSLLARREDREGGCSHADCSWVLPGWPRGRIS
jgi:hypothetical protein